MSHSQPDARNSEGDLKTPATRSYIEEANKRVLGSYRANPTLIEEQASQELATAEGAYGRRQVYELIQNGADALRKKPGGKISLILTNDALYCANSGEPISKGGVRAILHSYLSGKTGDEIGRYGIGFKSVLGISDRPAFYGPMLSFIFDPDWTAQAIQEEVPGYDGPIPKLRVAKAIDTPGSGTADSFLGELLSWATSVVKLPLSSKNYHWLHEDLKSFPAEFLLFSPQVAELTLSDFSNRTKVTTRNIRRTEDGLVSVYDNESLSEWHVFSTVARPSIEAIADGGHFAGRNSVDLFWAVPLKGKSISTGDGAFWAYFPIAKEKMSLRGILNSAWKVNDDRQNILEGQFNDELLDEAVSLIFEHLESLVDLSDPGKILELYPGRRAERFDADLRLTDRFYTRAKNYPTVPDTSGVLRRLGDIKLPPSELPPQAVEHWNDCPAKPSDWAHPTTILNAVRSARLDLLMSEGLRRLVVGTRASATDWLEALVGDNQLTQLSALAGIPREEAAAICSKYAVLSAAAILIDEDVNQRVRNEVLSASILLTTNQEFVTLQKDTVFLPVDRDGTYEGVNVVHHRLVEELTLSGVFEKLEVTEVDAASRLRSLLSSVSRSDLSHDNWKLVWSLATAIETNTETTGRAAAILRQYFPADNAANTVFVLTRDGEFTSIEHTLLPGMIVPADGSRSSSVVMDIDFHRKNLETIRDLGGVESPVSGGGRRWETWFDAYWVDARDKLFQHIPPDKGRPGQKYLDFRQSGFPGPLEAFPQLDDEGRLRMTECLLNFVDEPTHWEFGHRTGLAYPTAKVDSPSIWMIRQHGRLRTSKGILKPDAAVGPALGQWKSILPVADVTSETAKILGLPQSINELSGTLVKSALTDISVDCDIVEVGSFYSHCCRNFRAPNKILCLVGNHQEWRIPSEVTVAVDKELNDAVEGTLRALNIPFVEVRNQDEEQILRNSWNLKPASASLSYDVRAVPSGSETPVGDVFQKLSLMLTREQSDLLLVPCSHVRVEIVSADGSHSEDREHHRDGDRLFYIDSLSRERLLEIVGEQLHLQLELYDRAGILDFQESIKKREKRDAVKDAPSLHEKLLLAVGSSEVLKKRLSDGLINAYEQIVGSLTDKAIAQLFLNVYGVETLIQLKDELQNNGFQVPKRWAGSFPARRFVRELGFPVEFAGFEKAGREAEFDVHGPRTLPPLHDFQKLAVNKIKGLLLSGEKSRRGLLSLPTGAGKTRVAVEAIIRTIRDDDFPSPILWVAQSDELCEQAVKTWSELWRSIGAPSDLRMNRLWAQNEADQRLEGPQVIVATVQKLQHVIDSPEYDWLKNCSALIIDEAHQSVTPEYTAVLEWVEVNRKFDRCPLIGLTATAFRGGEKETARLAYRYGRYRIDEGILGDEPYRRLQEMNVLAKVSHKLLEGINVDLTDLELEELRQKHRLPTSAESRIGADAVRNAILVNSVKEMDESWPVLLFGVSVENAQTVAALLNASGISAAAISAETASGARRHYIEEFRRGRLRVLTNYGVLTTGFDAPAVRAIVMGRPTFSPVLYQQMIGRGLRGPLNQGKDECLIVNVKDNFTRFGEELAFREFEYLWSKD